MIAETPEPFTISIISSDGRYELAFTPNHDEGTIETTVSGQKMLWHVETVDVDPEGNLVLAGLTRGSETVWNDCFWFVLTTGKAGSKIEYWGEQVLFRTDCAPDGI
jgi:hypothetical protein